MKQNLATWPKHASSFRLKFRASGRLVIWQLAERRDRSELLDESLALLLSVEKRPYRKADISGTTE
jgi:hypothetical protein